MKQAFRAEELGRVYNEDGTIGHAEAKIGDAIVMAFDAKEEWPDTPCFLTWPSTSGQSHLIFGTGSTGYVTTMRLSNLCCANALYKPPENLDAIALKRETKPGACYRT
jgi:lactate dehydrogenase-like 2-hydroxyacid dehydrogenase